MRPTHWLWIHRTMTAPFPYVCGWTSQSLCAWELAGKNNRLFPIYLLYISTNITHAPSSNRVRKVQGCCACLKMALVSVSVGNRKVLTFSYSLAILKHSKWFSQQIKNFWVSIFVKAALICTLTAVSKPDLDSFSGFPWSTRKGQSGDAKNAQTE